MEADEDYVGQLKQVFDQCDSSGQGRLSKEDLEELCEQLQVEDQSEALVNRLIGSSSNKTVGFDEFKDGFVAVLSQCVDLISTEDEVSAHDDLAGELTPKFVRDGKKYGRRSRPDNQGADTPLDFPELSDVETDDESLDAGIPEQGQTRLLHTTPVEPPLASAVTPSVESRSESPLDNSESVYESDGGLNRSGRLDRSQSLDDEVEALRQIWVSQGVGKSGFLTYQELGVICEKMDINQNEQELADLFEKLDADRDGRVSFDEFVRGLSHHGPNAASSRPQSSQGRRRTKLNTSMNNLDSERRTQTPSILSAFTGSGYFSFLDPESTGYSLPDDVLEYWESFGIPQHEALEVLEMLDFDLEQRINLQELSSVLEQELLNIELDNAIYQVAIHTYRHELKHVKGCLESADQDKEKLKQDIEETKNQNNVLIRESDERLVSQEKMYENTIAMVEKRYQEQMKTLQSQLDNERELLTSAAQAEKQKLEQRLEKLLEAEKRLKEELSLQQCEVSSMDKELHAYIDKTAILEKENERIKRDLTAALEEQRKLQHDQSFKLEELEDHRNHLSTEQTKFNEQKIKDLEDENKELRDRVDEIVLELEELKQQLASKKTEDRLITRRGSVMSDYTQVIVAQADQTPDKSDSGSEASEHSDKVEELESLRLEADSLRQEVITLTDKYHSELKQLRDIHDVERSDLRLAHKHEIQRIEQKHRSNVSALESELDKIRLELSRVDAEWKRRYDTDKSQLAVEATKESMEVVNKLQDEHRVQLKNLQQKISRDNETELRMLKDQLSQENYHTETRLHNRINEYENMFDQGVSALKGRLKEDFYNMVEEQVQAEMEVAKRHLESEFEVERDELYELLNKEKKSMEDQYNDRLDELESQMDDIEEDVRAQCEEEFMDQLKVVQSAFDEERGEYESEITKLKLTTTKSGDSFTKLRSVADDSSMKLQNVERELQSVSSERDVLVHQRNELTTLKNKMMLERNSAQNEIDEIKRKSDRTENLLRAEISELNIKLASLREKENSLRSQISQPKIEPQTAIPLQSSYRDSTENSLLSEENRRLQSSLIQTQSELESAHERIFKLSTDLDLTNSQHHRQVQDLKLKSGKMYDSETYQKLEIRLQSERQRSKELEEALRVRGTESNKLLIEGRDDNDKALVKLRYERDEIRRQLLTTRDCLTDVTSKLKTHLLKSTKTDQLVRDLYYENADLMEALCVSEKRQKTAEWSNRETLSKYQHASKQYRDVTTKLKHEITKPILT